MEELLEILEEAQPGVDFATAEHLIDNRILGSLVIMGLIGELEDAFDITIPMVEIIPENFNSAKAMYAMICRLQEEA